MTFKVYVGITAKGEKVSTIILARTGVFDSLVVKKKTNIRSLTTPNVCFFWLNGKLSGFDADALRFDLFRLRQLDGQDAVLKVRFGLVGLDAGRQGQGAFK